MCQSYISFRSHFLLNSLSCIIVKVCVCIQCEWGMLVTAPWVFWSPVPPTFPVLAEQQGGKSQAHNVLRKLSESTHRERAGTGPHSIACRHLFCWGNVRQKGNVSWLRREQNQTKKSRNPISAGVLHAAALKHSKRFEDINLGLDTGRK